MADVRLEPYGELDDTGRKKLLDIYIESFPEEERLDFEDILVRSDTMDCGTRLYGIVDADDGRVVGMTYTVVNEELMPGQVYVFFLAIGSNVRGSGYGSAALDAIAEAHPGLGLCLDIETVTEMDGSVDDSDRANRLRRLHFYEENGFSMTGKVTETDYISYDLLYRGDGTLDEAGLKNTFDWLEQEIEGLHI